MADSVRPVLQYLTLNLSPDPAPKPHRAVRAAPMI